GLWQYGRARSRAAGGPPRDHARAVRWLAAGTVATAVLAAVLAVVRPG
ncbi:MAG: hypothetical protein QOF04_1490, partial [Solirubrobacteraceae bacterium]|nr:hypothetical protein [Solirubrobacteraceae bacterium]